MCVLLLGKVEFWCQLIKRKEPISSLNFEFIESISMARKRRCFYRDFLGWLRFNKKSANSAKFKMALSVTRWFGEYLAIFIEKLRQNRQLGNGFRHVSHFLKITSEFFLTLFVLFSKGFQNNLLFRAFSNLINRKSHKWRNVAQSRNTEFD